MRVHHKPAATFPVHDLTIFLHSIGLDAHCWQFARPQLSAFIGDAAFPDLLWHGRRPRPPGDVTVQAMADDIAPALGEHTHVVGVSLGAAVAQHLAIRHPGRVDSLLLVATSASAGRPGMYRERAQAAITGGMTAVLDDCLQRWLSPGERADPGSAALEYVRRTLLAADPQSFAAGWRALGAHDARAGLARLGIPVTVVHPVLDSPAKHAEREAMARLLMRGRFVTAPGPHLLHIEEPEAFAAVVREHRAWAESVNVARDAS